MERAKKLQARGEFTQIYEAAKRRLAQGHCQKNFPVTTTPPHKEFIKKTICAEIRPNTRRCQRVFCPLVHDHLHEVSP
jgi:hypothetical protein